MKVPPSFWNEWVRVGAVESLDVRMHTKLSTKTLDTTTLSNATKISIFHCNMALLLRVECEGGLRSFLCSRFAVTFVHVNVSNTILHHTNKPDTFILLQCIQGLVVSKMFQNYLAIGAVHSFRHKHAGKNRFVESCSLRRLFGSTDLPTISSYWPLLFFY